MDIDSIYQTGPVMGVVSDNADPDNLGRIKVKIEKFDMQYETDWIPIVTLYKGAFFLPEIDDIVVVALLGDSDNFVALGSIWTANQTPPESGENTDSDLNADGENNLRFIKSRAGHQIIFDDKDGEEKLQIISSKGKTRIDFLSKDKKMSFKTDKSLSIKATKNLGVKAKEGLLKFSKGLKLQADEIIIESKGKNIKTKASQNISLEGGTVKLN